MKVKALLAAALLLATVLVFGGRTLPSFAQTADPSLYLDPSSGPPPTVNGNLRGTGWCTPINGITMTGALTLRTAPLQVDGDGNLIGGFQVTEDPTRETWVVVTAHCREGDISARAQFTFDSPTATPPTPTPPPPTATPTPAPEPTRATATPTPTTAPEPTRPGATPTPTTPARATSTPSRAITPLPTPPPVPEPQPGQGTIMVVGCEPEAADVSVRLYPVAGMTGTPAFTLPALETPNPQVFLFALPTGAEPGAQYRAEVAIDDPECPPQTGAPAYIMPVGGGSPSLVALIGNTTLQESSLGNVVPQGGFGAWVTYRQVGGALATVKQLFNWSSQSVGAARGTWQLSLQPFPGGAESLESPPGLFASGDVDCATCMFTVNLGEIFPPEPEPPPPPPPWLQAVVQSFLKPSGQFATSYLNKDSGATQAGLSTGPVTVSASPVTSLPVPLSLYFRIIPRTAQGLAAGPASNTAILEWTGSKSNPIEVSIVDCTLNPTHPICPPPPPPPEYTLEFMGYHGYIPSQSGHVGCFIVTKDATVAFGFDKITYKKDQKLCPPEPEEPGLLEQIVNFITNAIDWVSEAYADLKAKVISFVGQIVPASICPPSCLSTALDMALIAAGVPPSLPNFEQLTEQGLDYLAEEAVAQAGLPPGIHDLAKEEFKKGIEAGIEAAKYAYADSVDWLPDGVPVKPDPLGSVQPAALKFKITRNPTSTGQCTLGPVNVSALAGDVLPGTSAELAAKAQTEKAALPWGMLFEGLQVPAPALNPGQTLEWEITLKPALSYGYPNAKYWGYNYATDGWSAVYFHSEVDLSLSATCSTALALSTPAHTK